MAGKGSAIGYKVMALAFTIPAGIAARKVLSNVWESQRHSAPPANPAKPGVEWGEAIAWAVVSGVVYAGARLVAARGAAAIWETLTGNLPPGVEAGTV